MALLARGAEPIVVRRALPGDAGDTQARYLEAAIGGVLFASIYLPNGNPQPGPKFAYKLAWFERLIAARRGAAGERPSGGAGRRLQRRADRARHLSDDVRTATTRCSSPSRAQAYARLLQQGWTDAIRARHPEATVYTFWDYLRNRWPRNAGLRIDHLLLSESIAGRLREAEVDRDERGSEGASDHAPVWAQLATVRASRRKA